MSNESIDFEHRVMMVAFAVVAVAILVAVTCVAIVGRQEDIRHGSGRPDAGAVSRD